LLGRFLQTDPSGTKGGVNLYAYAKNDPLDLVDISGKSADAPSSVSTASSFNFSEVDTSDEEENAADSTSRGISSLGGIFSSQTNAAGGVVVTSTGSINQNDVAPYVNSGMYTGSVNIITGVHGQSNGTTTPDISLYNADVVRFGSLPGVTIYNYPTMTGDEINSLLNGSGTTIGAFCNSGACLSPFQ
jgi:uncharacterized protein RhaS with RHS repeats